MEALVFGCICLLALIPTYHGIALSIIAGGSFCKIQTGHSGTCTRVKSCEGAKRSDKGNSRDCLWWHTCCITEYSDELLAKRARFYSNNGRGQPNQNSQPSFSSSPQPPSSQSRPSFAETSIPNLRITGCGIRKSLTDFIVGGRQAEFWPWMSAIFYRPQGSSTSRFQCGGTVISKRYILTAAHCVTEGARPVSPARVTVRIGGLTPRGDGHIRRISEIQIHDDYTSQMHYNDIALLTLAEDIESKNVVPICLPTPGMFNANFYQRNATVIGWGLLESSASSMSATLREAKVPVVPPTRCNRRYQRLAALSLPQGITDTQLCAGSDDGSTDACQGDSGGPLVLEDRSKKWTLIGIVSFGFGCAEPEYPGVYTRVAKYLSWIFRHTDIPARNTPQQ